MRSSSEPHLCAQSLGSRSLAFQCVGVQIRPRIALPPHDFQANCPSVSINLARGHILGLEQVLADHDSSARMTRRRAIRRRTVLVLPLSEGRNLSAGAVCKLDQLARRLSALPPTSGLFVAEPRRRAAPERRHEDGHFRSGPGCFLSFGRGVTVDDSTAPTAVFLNRLEDGSLGRVASVISRTVRRCVRPVPVGNPCHDAICQATRRGLP